KRVLAEATRVVLAEVKRKRVPIGFKDLGAGGISCAVSEMAEAGGVGADIDLDAVNKFPDNLSAQVIACSETQERYVMFVPDHFTEFVLNVYNREFDLPHIYSGAGAYVIGHTTDEKRFKLSRNRELVCDAGIDAITTGIEYTREKRKGKPRSVAAKNGRSPSPRQALLSLLGSFNIADKAILYQHYDSEVQARAVIRPGEADAAVAMFMPGEPVGVALGIGGNSMLGLVDPYLGGAWAVVEAVRNVACVGALPLAVTDCLNFGDPEDPEVFSEFCEAVRGIGDACRGLVLRDGPDGGIPVVSGNVSFYNQSEKGAPIAPTPIVACAGRLEDASVAQTMGFKKSESTIVLLGTLHDLMAGSEYVKQFGMTGRDKAPRAAFEFETAILKTLLAGFEKRMVTAAHDIGHGGLLVTLSEMMFESTPNDIGCDINAVSAGASTDVHVFSEYGGIVVEIPDSTFQAFKEMANKNGAPWHFLGRTTSESKLTVGLTDDELDVPLSELRAAAFEGKFNQLFA
ncbi:MAG: AIR synthase-related protein, partial [bacterium]|nr:AIR synthase-related protein [bacterium]